MWAGSRFILHQTLEIQEVLSFSLFSRGNALHLAVAVKNKSDSCLLYQWSNNQFQNPQLLSPSSSAKQVETFHIGADIYLLMVTDGNMFTLQLFVSHVFG